MPSPIVPNDIKDAIPTPGGNFCQKFLNSLNLPNLFYKWFAWAFKEDGTISDEFATDLCNLGCLGDGDGGTGGGGGGTGLATPQNVLASDGAFSDKVLITWSAVANATVYDVFRWTSADPQSAQLIASPTNLQFSDTSATPGTIYFYWVKARNSSQVSAFSSSDSGYIASALTAVSNLECTKGHSASSNIFIGLVFSPPADADTYDIYRNTVDDFSTAELLDHNRRPHDNSSNCQLCSVLPCDKPIFLNNGAEMLYIDRPTIARQYMTLYYWVVAKKTDGTNVIAISGPSNGGAGAAGWAIGDGSGTIPISLGPIGIGSPWVVPSGATRVWFTMFGGGAGGAGGDASFGGGGGGGGAVVSGNLPVSAGKNLQIVNTPNTLTSPGGANAASAAAGMQTKLQYDGSGSFVDIAISQAAGGGQYNPAGGGAGGGGSVASVHGSVTSPINKSGRAGLPGVGTQGGRGGNRFGGIRACGTHVNGNPLATGGQGTSGGGGGSWASPAGTATGGDSDRGFGVVVFYLS